MNRVMKSFIVHADQLDQAHGVIQVVTKLELFCKDFGSWFLKIEGTGGTGCDWRSLRLEDCR